MQTGVGVDGGYRRTAVAVTAVTRSGYEHILKIWPRGFAYGSEEGGRERVNSDSTV